MIRSPLDLYGDDERVTVHGLAGLSKRRAHDMRRILLWEGIRPDSRLDTVRVGDLRDALLIPRAHSDLHSNRHKHGG